MEVQLLDIDLEFPPEQRPQVPARFFGYNHIDITMMIFAIVLAFVMIGFFIWFGVEHSK